MTCNFCQNTRDNKEYTARELREGTRESFSYFQCSKCKCIQIAKIPDNLSDYYPKNYYSYTKQIGLHQGKLTSFLKRKITQHTLGRSSVIGGALNQVLGNGFLKYLKNCNLTLNSRILDVGCGNGALLASLFKFGFKDLTGTDVYIDKDYIYNENLRVYKKDISDLNESFDFIMLNHVFEHIAEQEQTVKNLKKILTNDGILLIRIPVSECYVWRKYNVNMVTFDAPRHLYIHSEQSICDLFAKEGFVLEEVKYDSAGMQFWASEQYENDIALTEENSYYVNPERSIFSKKQIKAFEEESLKLNKNRDGNRACFYFRKSNS